MKALRGWSESRAKQEWDDLRSGGAASDQLGPPWSRERLKIPAYLTGESSDFAESSSFESKALNTLSKTRVFKDDEITKVRAELPKGFSTDLAHEGFSESKRFAPLPAYALTSGSSAPTPEQLLRGAAHGEALAQERGEAPAPAPAQGAAAAAAGGAAQGMRRRRWRLSPRPSRTSQACATAPTARWSSAAKRYGRRLSPPRRAPWLRSRRRPKTRTQVSFVPTSTR